MVVEGTYRNLLVMEDTSINYRILAQIVAKACPGVRATFVKSSSEALKAIQQIPFYKLNPQTGHSELTEEKRTFFAVILDNQVPEHPGSNTPVSDEGIRVAQAIRAMEKAGDIGKMRLFSYSADADQSKFEIPLFDRVLGKGVTSADLAGILNEEDPAEQKSPQMDKRHLPIVKKAEGVQNNT